MGGEKLSFAYKNWTIFINREDDVVQRRGYIDFGDGTAELRFFISVEDGLLYWSNPQEPRICDDLEKTVTELLLLEKRCDLDFPY